MVAAILMFQAGTCKRPGCALHPKLEIRRVQIGRGEIIEYYLAPAVGAQVDLRVVALLRDREVGIPAYRGDGGEIDLVRAVFEIGDRVVPVIGVEHEGVGPGHAGERVVPGSAGEGVFALAAVDAVFALAADQPVAAEYLKISTKFDKFPKITFPNSPPARAHHPPAFGTLPSLGGPGETPHRHMRGNAGRCSAGYPKNSAEVSKKSSRSVFTFPSTSPSGTGLMSRPCSAAMTPQVPSCANSLARTPRRVASTLS